ncbi:hypothetical protein GCM10009793_28430 [Brachybacterium phenoliresistens]
MNQAAGRSAASSRARVRGKDVTAVWAWAIRRRARGMSQRSATAQAASAVACSDAAARGCRVEGSTWNRSRSRRRCAWARASAAVEASSAAARGEIGAEGTIPPRAGAGSGAVRSRDGRAGWVERAPEGPAAGRAAADRGAAGGAGGPAAREPGSGGSWGAEEFSWSMERGTSLTRVRVNGRNGEYSTGRGRNGDRGVEGRHRHHSGFRILRFFCGPLECSP